MIKGAAVTESIQAPRCKRVLELFRKDEMEQIIDIHLIPVSITVPMHLAELLLSFLPLYYDFSMIMSMYLGVIECPTFLLVLYDLLVR
jgi:hypothetical protein